MTTFWIRAEASSSVGLGHVMRTIALAEVARDKGHSVQYVVQEEPWVAQLLQRRGFPSVAVSTTLDNSWMQRVLQRDVVVFDGYGFTAADHRSACETGATVAAIDDKGTGLFDIDLVVNPNPASPAGYDLSPKTRLLIGPRYALLRREFRCCATPPAEREGLLLTFGGTDPGGVGLRVVELLDDWRPFEPVRLVLGPGASAADLPRRRWLETVVDPPDPAAVFCQAQAAISAAGSTTWELLALGIPTGLVQVAANQQVVLKGAVNANAALDAGDTQQLPERLPPVLRQLEQLPVRRALALAGKNLVDGHGAERVFSQLAE